MISNEQMVISNLIISFSSFDFTHYGKFFSTPSTSASNVALIETVELQFQGKIGVAIFFGAKLKFYVSYVNVV